MQRKRAACSGKPQRQSMRILASQQPMGTNIGGAPQRASSVFSGLERTMTSTFSGQNPGQRNDWRWAGGQAGVCPCMPRHCPVQQAGRPFAMSRCRSTVLDDHSPR